MKRQTSSERLYKDNLPTLNRWKVKLGLSSLAELVDMWIESVDLQKKREFYNRLTTKAVFVPIKPLSGCKIGKKKICIQGKGSTCV